jgi:hypothetical protein
MVQYYMDMVQYLHFMKKVATLPISAKTDLS